MGRIGRIGRMKRKEGWMEWGMDLMIARIAE